MRSGQITVFEQESFARCCVNSVMWYGPHRNNKFGSAEAMYAEQLRAGLFTTVELDRKWAKTRVTRLNHWAAVKANVDNVYILDRIFPYRTTCNKWCNMATKTCVILNANTRIAGSRLEKMQYMCVCVMYLKG